MIDKNASSTAYREVEYFLYSCGLCKTEWKMDVFIGNIFCPLCGNKDAPLSVGDARINMGNQT